MGGKAARKGEQMIRYYTVTGDTKNGGDFEYTYHFYKDAKRKFDSITDVAYKSIIATDDKKGDSIIERAEG